MAIFSKRPIDIGIPQGSPISPILFLIYVSELFKNRSQDDIRTPSYIDDIALIVSSPTVEENCNKLMFKFHVEKKIADADRILSSMIRLSDTERGLSFQAMRQLYIACIISVADYGVPVWWKKDKQQHLLDKYQTLQNKAPRKVLGANSWMCFGLGARLAY